MNLKRGYYDVFVHTCAKYSSRIAIRNYEDGVYKSYTYSELYGVCEYISQNLQQLECNKGIIGLVSERNILIPCVIAAAHKCCTTFMFLDPSNNIEKLADNLNLTVIITIRHKDRTAPNEPNILKEPDKRLTVFDLIVSLYNCTPNEENKHLNQHSFIAMTSGSTGEPKHVQVPIQCIQPNIDDLTKMFNIVPQDIIFFSTPLTFDPSMVEILLACMNGASLLIAPERADILFPADIENSITFWQTTPSKFFQYSNADIKKILSEHSTLKVLALGGEPLNGIIRLKELKHYDNKTRIFSLYGVTEMSCWACAAELDLNRILTDREIPLGTCLSETEIIVQNKSPATTGNIVLVSKTRNCFILNQSKGAEEQNSLKFVDTGDYGEIKNGTIYYRGRRDDTIKRFGHKVNLKMIESIIMQCPRVKTCSCIWLPKPMLLVVYFSSETLTSLELSDFLKCKLDDKHWPDKVIRVDNLPTSPHGKISKQILSKMYEKFLNVPQTIESLRQLLLNELKVALSKEFTFDQIKGKDFFSLGGTSFLAVSICNKLSLTCPQFGKLIMPYMMSQRHSLGEIMEIAQKVICVEETKPKKLMKRNRSNAGDSLGMFAECTSSNKRSGFMESIYGNPVDFIVVWNYNTGKCVDASPILFQTGFNLYVTVGSHSGNIIVMDAIGGILHGTINVKARVEASVLCYQGPGMAPCGIVGTHDGTVICFTLEKCEELWRINVGSMIKSKVACCKGILYVASYDGIIRCLCVKTGRLTDSINVVDQAISADLAVAKDEYILLGTLSGVCASIHTVSNIVLWRSSLASPVFASPVVYDNDKYVVFAEVNGEIHCRTVEKGIKIWRFQGAKGNIFSSIYIKTVDKLKWQMVFGCYDNKVYSIHVKNFQPTLHWKTQLTSPIYCTPCGLSDKLLLAASNNGRLCVLEADNGITIAEHLLPNETFSTPATYGDYIFIGCRDDNIYSLKYTINM